MQSNRINNNGQQFDAGLICGMLRHSKAIVLLLVLIFSFLFSGNVAAQCGPGKISETIQGFGSILTANTSLSNGPYALGGPNGSGANFSTGGQYIIIDLIDTVRAGQNYSITWRQYPGEGGTSTLNWSESLDGSTFTVHPSSGIGTTNERYFATNITAANDTRFIRIFTTTTNDLNIDAISYTATKCFSNPCGAGFTAELISGNGIVSSNNSISNPNNANYVPDGNGAGFNSTTDWIRIRLPYTIPAGQKYFLVWRPAEDNAQMRIRESADGLAWSAAKYTASLLTSTVFTLHSETAGTATRYIEIAQVTNPDFYLDAIVFNVINCNPTPPDLDISGNFDFCASPVLIAPAMTITDAANQTISSAYVQIGTGFVSAEDRLSCTNAYGITSNYNQAYGVLYLSGEATTSQYQSVLRSVLYNNISGTPTLGNRQIIFSLERYNPIEDHYYRYVAAPNILWSTARLDADRAHLFGMQGYLITITSDAENNFLLYQMTGATWLGGSDFFGNESDWYWMTGPEAGTMFWQGLTGGTELTYANWNPGAEPNNYNGNDEVFAHIYAPGSSNAGTWNDELPAFNGAGYYIEFGGMPGDPDIDIEGIVNVNVITGTPIAPLISGSTSVCPNAAGVVYSTTNVPGHTYSWVVTGGTIANGQGTNSITVNWGNTSPGTVRVTESVGGACSVTTTDYSVTIGDIINPVITGSIPPANIEGCNVSAAPAAVTTVAALEGMGLNISDNCTPDASLVVTSGDVTSGTCPIVITRTYTITDAYGNFKTTPHTINIDDNTRPTWTTVAGNLDRTVSCSDAAGLTAAQALAPVATDNCDVTLTPVKTSGLFAAGTCPQAGTYTNTWTVSDDCGNAVLTVYTQTITVTDNTRPTWTTVAGNLDRTVSCSDAAGLTAAQALAPVATDNCDVTLTPVKTSGLFAAGTCPQAGTYTNTWTVSDDCGNAVLTVYTQTITVTDNTRPTWTTVAGNLDRTVSCSDAAGLTAAQALAPVATDNCDVTLTPVKTSGLFAAGTCPQAGTYTNTWTVSDDCGNAVLTVYTQTITVTDNTRPTWTTVAGNLDRTVSCSDAAGLTAAQALAPVATDNCDVTLTPVKTSGLFAAGTCPQAGTYTNTWTVSDDCGNAVLTVYTQTITVTDNTRPTWTTVAGNLDRTVSCSDAAGLTAAQALAPVATDNCDVTLTPVKTSGLFAAGTCPQAGTYTNTWTVSDDCGNAVLTVYTQTITVTDNTRPTWTTVAGNLDRTVSCSDAAGLTAAQALAPVATDNCDVTLTPVKTSGLFAAGTCPQAGTYTNTWTVSDDCGNAVLTVYTQTITVTDNTQADVDDGSR